MSDLMDKHTKTPKWYIDGVTTAGATIAVNGMFLGKVIDENVAEAIVDAVNGQRERSALLKIEEALRQARGTLAREGWTDKGLEFIDSALSLLDEARNGK